LINSIFASSSKEEYKLSFSLSPEDKVPDTDKINFKENKLVFINDFVTATNLNINIASIKNVSTENQKFILDFDSIFNYDNPKFITSTKGVLEIQFSPKAIQPADRTPQKPLFTPPPQPITISGLSNFQTLKRYDEKRASVQFVLNAKNKISDFSKQEVLLNEKRAVYLPNFIINDIQALMTASLGYIEKVEQDGNDVMIQFSEHLGLKPNQHFRIDKVSDALQFTAFTPLPSSSETAKLYTVLTNEECGTEHPDPFPPIGGGGMYGDEIPISPIDPEEFKSASQYIVQNYPVICEDCMKSYENFKLAEGALVILMDLKNHRKNYDEFSIFYHDWFKPLKLDGIIYFTTNNTSEEGLGAIRILENPTNIQGNPNQGILEELVNIMLPQVKKHITSSKEQFQKWEGLAKELQYSNDLDSSNSQELKGFCEYLDNSFITKIKKVGGCPEKK